MMRIRSPARRLRVLLRWPLAEATVMDVLPAAGLPLPAW
jgi:hypothetical protein